MINLSHNKNLNFAFFFSYFLIYNLHATTSTLLPEQSPKYPQFTTPLASKHSDLPQFLTLLLSHPIHCLQLTHAPCIRHFFSIFSFSFFFVIFRKFNVFFLSGLQSYHGKNTIARLFLFFLLNPNMQDFSRKGKFLQEKLVVEFGWREDTAV